MKFFIIFIVIIFLSTGCGGSSQLAGVPMTDKTPLGFNVSIQNSVYVHGLFLEAHTITDKEAIKIILLSWVDQRAREYLTLGRTISVYNSDTGEWTERPVVLEDILRYQVILYDDFKFACVTKNAPTGWCGGLYDGGIIGVSIYHEWSGLENPPPYNYPPHTLAWSTRTLKWWAGIIPDNQIGIPALLHEWDNALGKMGN